MFEYEKLRACPGAFRGLTGMSATEFEALLADFLPAQQRLRRSSAVNGEGRPRRRAPGGGAKPKLDDRHRLLLALVWLRVYPTYELLGFFFGLHKRNAQLHARAVLAVLDTLPDFPFDRPGPDRRALSTVEEVMAAFPSVRLVIDAKEQRVNRPGASHDAQKPYYSGKKKAHTLKSQVGVDEQTGRVVDVSDTVPGPWADIKLLKKSRLLTRLPEGVGGIGDLAYVGIADLHPEGLGAAPRKKPRGKDRPPEDARYNRAFSRCRIVVEHAIGRLRRFRSVSRVNRHRRKGHAARVRAVAGLVNRMLPTPTP